jgi:lipopolysaccharide transport system ATP-binding protein
MVLEQGKTVFNGGVAEGIEYYMKSNIKNSYLPLSKRTDRYGMGNLRFTDIKLKGEKEVLISEVFSGKPLYIDIDFITKTKLHNPEFRIMFLDSKGVIRFLCNNHFSMNKNLDLNEQGEHTLRCSIPELPLPKGEYTIQLTCFSFEEEEDDLEAAVAFTVVGGDFFKTGKEQIMNEGVLVKNTFSLVPKKA